MALNRGVVTEITTTSASPLRVSSSIPIAIVTVGSVSFVGGYDGVDEAIADLTTKGMTTSTAMKYLNLMVLMNATAPIILSIAKSDATATIQKTNVLNAISAVKQAPSLVKLAPDIVIAPDVVYDIDVANALISVADRFGGRCFYDLNATTQTDAVAKRNAFGSRRITLVKNGGIINGVVYDGAGLAGCLRVAMDGESDIGWSKSISNCTLPISAVVSPTDFYPGMLDDTDTLTNSRIMSIIFYKGFRTWEYGTCDVDAVWQDARRVRIFDKLAETVRDGIFFAIDKGINELTRAKKSIREFMADMSGAGVILGFEVMIDEKRTTATAITNGEFYFIVDAQEMPSPRLIKVTFNRVDRFSGLLFEVMANA